jgi:hypothetical protein
MSRPASPDSALGGLLTRKISAAKWREAGGLEATAIQADAVTADLKTQSNELSFWKADSDHDDELHETVLAFATTWERLNVMDVTWVERDAVEQEQLTVLDSPDSANTPVESLKARHVDVAKLDYVRLGKVATLIQRAVRAKQVRRFKPAQVLDVLVAAVRSGRVSVDALREGELQDKVREKLKQPPQP